MDNVFIKYMDLPTSIRGFTKEEYDGSYTIVINARLAHEMNVMTYMHEINHIIEDDFNDVYDVDEIEANRHK